MSSGEASAGAKTEPRHFFGHGRLAYIQIPAVDLQKSADFYARMFGWQVREGSPKHLGFSDGTGDVIGSWVTAAAVSSEPGIMLYIYVHGLDPVLEKIVASGAEVVKPPYPEGDIWVATFRDPAGNVIGIWQKEPR